MCGEGNAGPSQTAPKTNLSPPTWEDISLPADHILRHLTDAHCHPTDLDLPERHYAEAKLGSIAAMATAEGDQDKVRALGRKRGWKKGQLNPRGGQEGVSVVSCFGYHPWFTHRYSLLPSLPSKEDHYTSLFFTPKSDPNSKNRTLLRSLLPYLPDPIPFQPLLDKLRADVQASLDQGNLTMLGEIGLDSQARMRWPTDPAARILYAVYLGEKGKEMDPYEETKDGEWKRLTMFKTDMKHQRRIVEMQMEVAVELGVNVSFHCVAAPGQTLEVLTSFRDRHRSRFTNRINVDLHSAGGWQPEFWRNAQKQLLNLYASPSVLITGRVGHASELLGAISDDRMLVESDSHDVRMMASWVWGAVEWMAAVKGWKVEGKDDDGSEWTMDAMEEEVVGRKGKVEKGDVWAVRTLERNWARFMHIVD